MEYCTQKQKAIERKNTPCRCGKQALYRIGTVEHVVLEAKIRVNNVPHLYCDFCKRISYGADVDLVSVLRDAYLARKGEVDYAERGDVL